MEILRTIGRGLTRAWDYWTGDIRKRRTCLGKGASIGIGLFVVLFACAAMNAAVTNVGQRVGMVPTWTPSPLPTSTPLPTATSTPAPTAEPTAVPTRTPKPAPTVAIPTNTLVPASAPAGADVGTDVRTYFGVVAPKLGTFGEALSTFGQLLQHPQIGDQTWTIKAAAAIYVMNTTHQELRDLSPVPEPAQPFHAALLDATEDCSDSGSLVAKAIDSADVALITQAGELMQRCNTKVDRAAPMLDALVAEYGK